MSASLHHVLTIHNATLLYSRYHVLKLRRIFLAEAMSKEEEIGKGLERIGREMSNRWRD